jgi:urease accessory protein
MLRFNRLHTHPLDAIEAARAIRLRLDFDERVKSRLATMTADGVGVAIVLPRGTVMREGTVLGGDDDDFAIIEAAPQAVARVSADAPLSLMRAIYHLANRHVAIQLAVDHVLIERDPVLERMLAALGAHVEHLELPFDPEPGAYEGHSHAHGPSHHEDVDQTSATLGEQLSIEAHSRRAQGRSA